MTDPSLQLLTEVKTEIVNLRTLLVGNGAVGVMEQVRANRRDIETLTGAVAELRGAVKTVNDSVSSHVSWHDKPANMTVYQLLAHSSIRFVLLAVLVLIGLVFSVLGASGAAEIIRAIL